LAQNGNTIELQALNCYVWLNLNMNTVQNFIVLDMYLYILIASRFHPEFHVFYFSFEIAFTLEVHRIPMISDKFYVPDI